MGEAIAGLRDERVPGQQGLSAQRLAQVDARSVHGSLRRWRTDRLDLYLLHWARQRADAETVEAFEALLRDGLIRN